MKTKLTILVMSVLLSSNLLAQEKSDTLALYLGKRWVWNNGFNIALTGGYGTYLRESSESRGEFKDKYFGELSIGYAF